MTTLTAFCKEADVTTEASYVIAKKIARSKRPYSDGKFIKENILQVASKLDRSNKKLQRLISQIALSRQTIVHRIGDPSANVTMSLKNDLVSSVAFSIALDESTDIQDKLQLAVFVRYVSRNFCVKKEFAWLSCPYGHNKRSWYKKCNQFCAFWKLYSPWMSYQTCKYSHRWSPCNVRKIHWCDYTYYERG